MYCPTLVTNLGHYTSSSTSVIASIYILPISNISLTVHTSVVPLTSYAPDHHHL